MQTDMEQALQGVAGADEAERLQGEGGKGRKATQNPREDEEPGRIAEHGTRLGQGSEATDDGTADHVDRQRPPGNNGERQEALHGADEKEAAGGADAAAEADEKNVGHEGAGFRS